MAQTGNGYQSEAITSEVRTYLLSVQAAPAVKYIGVSGRLRVGSSALSNAIAMSRRDPETSQSKTRETAHNGLAKSADGAIPVISVS